MVAPHKQLKSLERFLRACEPLTEERLEKWKEELVNPDVKKINYVLDTNYLTETGKRKIEYGQTRTRVNLIKWGIEENPRCNCEKLQNEHLLKCTNTPYIIQDKNYLYNTLINRKIDFIKYWLEIGILVLSTTREMEDNCFNKDITLNRVGKTNKKIDKKRQL